LGVIRLRIVPLAAVAVALCCTAVPASPSSRAIRYNWSNVAVGGGGFAPNIVFSRAEQRLAYLRTDMGGAYRWEGRQQRWIPLQDANAIGSYMGVESVAPDPLNPNVVYLAAGMCFECESAILRSTDRGVSWSVVPAPFRMGGNEDGRGLGERLAIDPNRTSTLLFGSRHDGLWRSDDSGNNWRKVASFPYRGLGRPLPHATHAGISFILFDSTSGVPGKGSRTIYAAVADPGVRHLYRSSDGGNIWSAVAGEPPPTMLPVRADFDPRGELYIAYSTGIGPNGIEDGSVWRFDPRNGRWNDITPDPDSQGGYMGISIDRSKQGRLAVSSINRWHPGDTVWLSEDDGRSWTDLGPRSRRDTTLSPFLTWGKSEADFGHWTAGLAIDPFDGGTIAYTTGATLYRTDDALRPGTLWWRPWVRGIEQTAVITLISPTGGAHLISGFGDIAGFVHDRLDASPRHMHLSPLLNNTNNLDFAGLAPNVVVRSGSRHKAQADGASLAWSEDGGRTWQPLKAPPIDGQRADTNGEAQIVVSADGRIFVVATPTAMATSDRGRSWFAPAGLSQGARIIADKADARLFYAADFAAGRILVSGDGAHSFRRVLATGLPSEFSADRPRNREAQSPLQATPGRAGELWLLLGGKLFHSSDAGGTFRRATTGDIRLELFGLGRAAPGRSVPALYAIATKEGIRGVWRSDDGGATWVRINDDAHQWGLRFRVISGDPRIAGRVYVATDGRGIFYGDPATRR